MPLNFCEVCDNDPDKPSFKGNQVRGTDCFCEQEKDESDIDVKWHWNRLIGKSDQEPHSR